MEYILLDPRTVKVRSDRQRQDFDKDALIELAQKILDHGLLQAPGIDTQESQHIVWGERRLRVLCALAEKGRAIKFNGELLPVGMAPFGIAGTTDELELEQIELVENLNRVDLTWQEQTRATARIADMLARKKKRDDPTLAETPLEEINIPIAEVAVAAKIGRTVAYEETEIARHLSDPDVAKAKTKKEAMKVIAKKQTAEHRRQLAAQTNVAVNDDHQIFKGDCREVIKQLPDSMFTAVITDPPYGINMHKDQSWDGTYHEYDDTEAYCFNLVEQLLPEWDRTTKDGAHLYMFCDFAKFEKLRAIVEGYRQTPEGEVRVIPMEVMRQLLDNKTEGEASEWYGTFLNSSPVFEVMYFPFIWDKGNIASYPKPNHWPRKSYECILYGIKGNHTHSGLDLAVINVPQLQNQEHPAGKPLELYERLVLRSTLAGEAVFDCFAGQGNLLRAARRNKRKSVSIELSDDYYGLLAAAHREGNNHE